ncbi:hypothetical protein [Marinococcus halotolerans]|uniref:hypothetical protein n=1 Tax=Marinococcus halotolerans TaxID=301092 RepID=UPI0003B7179E|nr:hypothetical protein [Marinococcus halotolerans]
MRTKVRHKKLEQLEQEAAEETKGVFAGNKDHPLSSETKKEFANDLRKKEQEFKQQMNK